MPAPTAWPFVMAFGVALGFAGLVTTFSVSLVGAILFAAAAVGWFREVLPHEKEEAVPVAPLTEAALPVSRRDRVARLDLARGVGPHRARLPLEIHPISAGVKGGLAGSVAMAVLAMFYGVVAQGSIWYPINLLAAGASAKLAALSIEGLRAFHADGLALAVVIHLADVGHGGTALRRHAAHVPAAPDPARRRDRAAPLDGSPARHARMVNPALNARVAWPWFVVTQIGFGVVAGAVVTRTARVRPCSSSPSPSGPGSTRRVRARTGSSRERTAIAHPRRLGRRRGRRRRLRPDAGSSEESRSRSPPRPGRELRSALRRQLRGVSWTERSRHRLGPGARQPRLPRHRGRRRAWPGHFLPGSRALPCPPSPGAPEARSRMRRSAFWWPGCAPGRSRCRPASSPPPYAGGAGDASRGEAVYAAACASCHGPGGAGGPKAGSIVDGSYLGLVSDQNLRTTIIAGRPDIGHPDWRGDGRGARAHGAGRFGRDRMACGAPSRDTRRALSEEESMTPSVPPPASAPPPPQPAPSRRGFLLKLGVALNALAALVVAAPIVGYLLSPGRRKRMAAALSWIELSEVDAFPEGQTRLATYRNPFTRAVGRRDGRHRLLGAAARRTEPSRSSPINCAHLGCPVRWFPQSGLFMCPCHGGAYYADGEPRLGSAAARALPLRAQGARAAGCCIRAGRCRRSGTWRRRRAPRTREPRAPDRTPSAPGSTGASSFRARSGMRRATGCRGAPRAGCTSSAARAGPLHRCRS